MFGTKTTCSVLIGTPFFLALALLLVGLLAAREKPPARHQEATTNLRRLGGTVETNEGRTRVIFGPFGARHLEPLRHLHNLTVLDLHGQPLVNGHLVHIRPLVDLRELNLGDTLITDDGLADLQRLQAIEDLDLSGTRITDAGLAHLERLPKLKRLVLNRVKVSERAIARLQRALPRLKIIRK